VQVTKFQDLISAFASRHHRLLRGVAHLEDSWYSGNDNLPAIDRPIFVTGVARSGTTIILESLAKHPNSASHRYRDFPFVMTPVAWNWFLDRAVRADQEPTERAHKARILVTPESPEAMEEMIWISFFPDCHCPDKNNVLTEKTVNNGFEDFYRSHIRKILAVRGGSRYLAKGNYNLARLRYLGKLFPDARFLIPIRHPVSHVASLMKQHRLFCEAETHDPRVLNHMRRVGHYEFGLDRRAINFDDRATIDRIRHFWQTGEEARGWALSWASAYQHVADLLAANEDLRQRTMVVRFDELCNDPVAILKALFAHCQLEGGEDLAMAEGTTISAPTYYNHGLSENEIAAILAETEEAATSFGITAQDS
jgi:hypothetical protein